MKHWRNREDRKAVRITVRVRTDDGWIDATVRNVSSRGMMLQSPQPLNRNQFVEISRGDHRVIGRIVWADAVMSGVRAQDEVDIAALLAPPQAGSTKCSVERRSGQRATAPPRVASLDERAEASRLIGRAAEKVCLVVAIACGALFAISGASQALAEPLGQISEALGAPAP